MGDEEPVVQSLRRAVAAAPDDVTLRLHLAEVLLRSGDEQEAIRESAAVLSQDPRDPRARQLVLRALGAHTEHPVSSPEVTGPPRAQAADTPGVRPEPGFDWHAAESEVRHVAEPMFVEDDAAPEPGQSAWDVEVADVRLADVGGMTEVKERLEAAFLAPLRNPELRRLYGKSLRGGMLLYGPPGCGKTFIARAVAGEMGAKFLTVGLPDVLDMYVGNSERNLHDVFVLARRQAPVVLFLDEIDALGQKRSQTRNTGMRGAVNTLLTELDGVDGANEGVFVLAATNQPWDVDPALRRPGRLDRTLLVVPPDAPAREAILHHHLRQRPVEGIDLGRLAAQTQGYSGADLAYACEVAAERALLEGVRSGQARLIGMADLQEALRQVKPSTGPWFEAAKNVVTFADQEGTYAQLRDYLKKHRRL